MDKDSILAKLQERPFITIRELASCFEVSYGKMRKSLKVYNIKTKSVSERLSLRNKLLCTKPPIIITPEAHQLIIGSLLGDGSIIKKGTNCIFSILHSKVQEDYIKYKFKLFKKALLDVKLEYGKGYISRINNRPIKNNGRVTLKSKTNIAFNKYRNSWYCPKKIIPKDIYDLQPLGLAIWFMDDGTYNKSSFYFSTQCFTYKHQLILVDMMKKNFNLNCKIHKNKDKYILYLSGKDKQKFINIIKPYLCKSMYYKIIGHNKQGELLEA